MCMYVCERETEVGGEREIEKERMCVKRTVTPVCCRCVDVCVCV